MTQVSGDMTTGEMTLGRLDCKPFIRVDIDDINKHNENN